MEGKIDVPPKISSNRWDYIDLIEALGMLFVLIYHCTTYNYSIVDGQNSIIHYIRYFLQTILSTCVPLFFFANGYLLLNRSFELKKHIIKSIKMVALTFLWGAISVICISQIENVQLSLFDFLKSVWTWKQGWINHLWYMGALICIYCFFPILKKTFDLDFNVFLYFTVIATIFTFGNTFVNYIGSATLNILGISQSVYTFNWFNIFNPFRGIYGYALVYFCIGGLAHRFKDRILSIDSKKRNLLAICSIAVSCVTLFVFGLIFSRNSGKMFDVVWNGYDTIPTVINVICIYVLSLNYNKKIHIIKYISCNTLGIYFIHEIFIHLLKPNIGGNAFLGTFTGCLVFSTTVLLISLLFALIIKKIPLLKNLVKI